MENCRICDCDLTENNCTQEDGICDECYDEEYETNEDNEE